MFLPGRGGAGRGGGKRPMPRAPPSRPTTAPVSGRLSLGGGARSRPGSAPGGRGGAAAAPPGKEESFSLSSSGILDFGAIIRLTPDFIEEITRVESEGGSAKIKFAPNSNIPTGNVINVGGKEFGFTWSRDELCDIYEEHRSGEGGDGLLVERGSAWRKLNVHRILDESTKKHVKKRSEEAERLLKSRKAIVLDPSNPSMNKIVKKMAAAEVEGNMRRTNWKQKKEPFYKKQKVESNQVSNVGPPKSIYKPRTSSNKTGKSMLSASPLSTPPEQPAPGSAVSPFAIRISSRGDLNLEEITPPLDINKEHIDIGTFKEEMPSRSAHSSKQKVVEHKRRTGDQAIDFQSNRAQRASPNGMNLKLEKAVGETIPNLMKKNDSTIRNNEAPGKQIKPGMEVEGSSRREFESGSSPDSSHDIASAIESIFGEKITDEKVVDEEQPFERIDIMQVNPDPLSNADRKASNESEGKSSSSESGSESDSDSDSSGSGSGSDRSQSRSRSKSRSPVGSASASGSDSESDGSSSSKEGSDVDVDIMASEDEKEVGEPKMLSPLQIEMVNPVDGEHEHIDILGDQEEQTGSLPINLNNFGRDDNMANPIEDAKEFPINNSVKTSEKPEINFGANIGSNSYRTNSRFPLEDPFSSDQYNRSEDPHLQFVKSPMLTNERVTKKTFNEKQPSFNDWSSREKTETSKKMKSKRASGSEFFKEKIESAKRSKGASAAEVTPYGKSKDGVLPVNARYISPENARHDQYISNNTDDIKDMDSHDYSLSDHSRSVAFGNTRNIQHSPEFWSSSSLDAEQPGPRISDISAKRKSVDRVNKLTERMPVRADAIPKDKAFDETNFGEKHSSHPEYNRKSGDGPPAQMKKTHGDKSPVLMGKGRVLRRELSELELGELRELPAGGETVGAKRQSEGKLSLKPSENKGASTDSLNQGNQEGFCSRTPHDDPVDTARVLQRTMPSQNRQPSRIDVTDSEIKSHLDNSAELIRGGETRANHAGSIRKTSTSLPPQNDIKHGGQKGYKSAKESKQQKLSILGDTTNQSNNGVSTENETNGRKRRESSTEDDNSFYSKYDKEVPDLRDSIKDFSQYNDYVQEYREKFDCYASLNKNLEKIRNDFVKVGEELELAKRSGSEEYFRVVDQLREMYHQHGERNKQMKRVFLVLHEELKTLKQRIHDFVEMHTRE